MDDAGCYSLGFGVVWLASFLAIWAYAFGQWGFLVGLSIGWLPAAIGATIIAAIWPLIAIGIAILFVIYYLNN